MTQARMDAVIDALTADVRAVKPMPSPGRRAAITLAAMALVGAGAVYLLSDPRMLLTVHAGRKGMLALEMAAMLATGVLAVTAAFFASVPGRSRLWLAAPAPFFVAWLLLSGAGCYSEFIHGVSWQWAMGRSMHCLVFIIGVSAVLAPPLLWLLSRAAPIDPLPVALLGGLGLAACSAFLLRFFHPLAVTFVDLTVHVVAVVLVVLVAGKLNRRVLAVA